MAAKLSLTSNFRVEFNRWLSQIVIFKGSLLHSSSKLDTVIVLI